LTEVLVTITIAAILAAVATPSFREFIATQRVKNASFEVMSMLTLTRSEAIKRNSTATLSGLGTTSLVITAGGAIIQQRESFANLTLICKSGGTVVTCTDVVYANNGRLQAITPSIEISSAASAQISCIGIDPSGRPTSKKGACG
jgi:type IV fimbrial biogenesis protein FimT